jgi:hypothetical protein
MKFADLAGYLGLLLGLGAALDIVLRKEWKARFAAALKNVADSSEPDHFSGSRLLTKIFGDKLFSRRALTRYALISVVSIILSFGFAYATTPEEIWLANEVFPAEITGVAVSILLVCLFGSIIGDMISYAQTRVFIRTVDNYKNPVISFGLAAADIIISLSIFLLVFSVSRFVCYLLVLDASAPALSHERFVMQEPLSQIFGRYVANADTPAEQERLAVARRVTSVTSDSQLPQLEEWLARRDSRPVADPDLKDAITYEVSRSCAVPPVTPPDILQTTDTVELAGSLAPDELSDSESQALIRRIILSDVARRSRLPDSPCPLHVLRMQRMLSTGELIRAAGLRNSFLASFERTLFDGYTVVGFKLAPYVYFDPSETRATYLSSVRTMASNSVLGASRIEPDVLHVLDDVWDGPTAGHPLVRVPFSPLLASALTTSLFFLVYLIFVLTAKLRVRFAHAVGRFVPFFEVDRALFLSISTAATLLVLSCYFVIVCVGAAWSSAFG